MARITPVAATTTDAAVAPQLAAVKQKLGVVPNLFTTLARSPVALNGYLGLSEATQKGAKLGAKDRERIALAVGQANECDYCLAAHSLLGKNAGLSESEIASARTGGSSEPRSAAIVHLARAIVKARGDVATSDLEAARAAGLDDGEILEVLANVVVNIFTNYANHLAATDVDFPAAKPLAA